MRSEGDWYTGSWLTQQLRELSIPSNNWLARIAHVPFDAIAGYRDVIDGMYPFSHRVHTFGHDPLVGLLIGTLDIMHGTITGVGTTGKVGVADTPLAGVHNPFTALAIEILHLLSDLPTKAGLPLPGWTIAMTMNVGNIGGQTINDLAREMYLSGYDSWHLLTMSTVPATVELALRAYWGIRSTIDQEFRDDVNRLSAFVGTTKVAENPRFRTLAFAAHGVAAAGNIGKLIAYGNNPLALNYAEWLAFFRALYRWAQDVSRSSPADALIEQFLVNRAELERKSSRLEGAPAMPSLPFDNG